MKKVSTMKIRNPEFFSRDGERISMYQAKNGLPVNISGSIIGKDGKEKFVNFLAIYDSISFKTDRGIEIRIS